MGDFGGSITRTFALTERARLGALGASLEDVARAGSADTMLAAFSRPLDPYPGGVAAAFEAVMQAPVAHIDDARCNDAAIVLATDLQRGASLITEHPERNYAAIASINAADAEQSLLNGWRFHDAAVVSDELGQSFAVDPRVANHPLPLAEWATHVRGGSAAAEHVVNANVYLAGNPDRLASAVEQLAGTWSRLASGSDSIALT